MDLHYANVAYGDSADVGVAARERVAHVCLTSLLYEISGEISEYCRVPGGLFLVALSESVDSTRDYDLNIGGGDCQIIPIGKCPARSGEGNSLIKVSLAFVYDGGIRAREPNPEASVLLDRTSSLAPDQRLEKNKTRSPNSTDFEKYFRTVQQNHPASLFVKGHAAAGAEATLNSFDAYATAACITFPLHTNKLLTGVEALNSYAIG
ncbi:hypothetical protein EVAR_31966_1 [Eumeta japonica]|uniref:Uncharacterized protein n=1 Tax=Eumeta variegata TaxID=151549 RepID=A0A4C1VU21_EUMVA|nr:hypothetical protein EVAR_31966_1 [Eumeta japonica]